MFELIVAAALCGQPNIVLFMADDVVGGRKPPDCEDRYEESKKGDREISGEMGMSYSTDLVPI